MTINIDTSGDNIASHEVDRTASQRGPDRIPYVPGRAAPLWMACLASLLVGGGISILVLIQIPVIVGQLANSDEVGTWLRSTGAQLPGPYLALLAIFGGFLAVWQLQNAVRAGQGALAEETRRAQSAVANFAAFAVGPTTVFLAVWLNVGVWAGGEAAQSVHSGEAIVATAGAAFVLWLSSAVAAAPEPNALMQLQAGEEAVAKDEELLRLSEMPASPSFHVASDRLVLRVVLMLLVLPVALGVSSEWLLDRGTGPSVTGVSIVVAFTSAFGILYIHAQRVGLRGAGAGVSWAGWVCAWSGWAAMAIGCFVIAAVLKRIDYTLAGGILIAIGAVFGITLWPRRSQAEGELAPVARELLALRAPTLKASIARRVASNAALRERVRGASLVSSAR